jgi:hypothetical protein
VVLLSVVLCNSVYVIQLCGVLTVICVSLYALLCSYYHSNYFILDSIKQEVNDIESDKLLPIAYKEGKIQAGRVFTVVTTTTKARTFTVAASSDTTGDNWGVESLLVTATPGTAVDRVAIIGTRWLLKGGDFRFEGTQSGTATAETIKVFVGSRVQYDNFKAANGVLTTADIGTDIGVAAVNTAAVAPAGNARTYTHIQHDHVHLLFAWMYVHTTVAPWCALCNCCTE